MLLKIRSIIEDFERTIRVQEIHSKSLLVTSKQAIEYATEVLGRLRTMIHENEFKSTADEIEFFKLQKPKVTSKLNYYLKIQDYLMEVPKGSTALRRQHIDSYQQRVQRKYEKHAGFVSYYRCGQSNLDEYYFTRNPKKCWPVPDKTYHFEDPLFNTPFSILLGKLMANDHFSLFLNQELHRLRQEELFGSGIDGQKINTVKCRWTKSKTDLIELIYALHASGAVEDGKAEIKTLVTLFENVFDIELHNPYRTYMEIRERSKDRTKFLNELQMDLQTRIKMDDGK